MIRLIAVIMAGIVVGFGSYQIRRNLKSVDAFWFDSWTFLFILVLPVFLAIESYFLFSLMLILFLLRAFMPFVDYPIVFSKKDE